MGWLDCCKRMAGLIQVDGDDSVVVVVVADGGWPAERWCLAHPEGWSICVDGKADPDG